ncbi:MAG: tetratricopeptide repeat protein [Acidobacteriota bacterium]
MTKRRDPGHLVFSCVLLILTACVTIKPRAVTPGPGARTLEGIPTIDSGVERCAAASLAGVATFWGRPTATDTLHEELPKADGGGVLSIDLLLAARDLGFESLLVAGDRDLIRDSIDAGQPLIMMLQIFDTIGRKGDLFHYVVVDGFDPNQDLVRVHFGDGKASWIRLEKISSAWADTDYATILIKPGDPTVGSSGSLGYAVALEEAGHLAEAEAVYRELLESDPDAALLWLNLGNVQRARGFDTDAEHAYRKSLELDAEQPDALNNLAWLLLENGSDLSEAEALARSAVSIGGPDPYLAQDTLGRILHRIGRCGEAIEVFETALLTTPSDSDARGWILYGLALAQSDCGDPEAAAATLARARFGTIDPELREQIDAALEALK